MVERSCLGDTRLAGEVDPLVWAIVSVYGEDGDPAILVAGLRNALLVLAVDEAGVPLTVAGQGVSWLCAFTSTRRLAEFAAARGDGKRAWGYVWALGWQLLDRWLPSVVGPCGVSLNLGSDTPMLFPPVRGVVADRLAVDVLGWSW